jgi:hypothetical protein
MTTTQAWFVLSGLRHDTTITIVTLFIGSVVDRMRTELIAAISTFEPGKKPAGCAKKPNTGRIR